MGISADLIEFGNWGDFTDQTIDDLNSEIPLYDFLPEHLHPYITQTSVEIIDDEYYRELFNDPSLVLISWDSEDGVTYLPETVYDIEYSREDFDYSKLIRVPYPLKTTNVVVNSIGARVLGYIGGREEFKSDIYQIYDNREHFPYLWHWSERDIILDTVPAWMIEKSEYVDTNNLYIDLGY